MWRPFPSFGSTVAIYLAAVNDANYVNQASVSVACVTRDGWLTLPPEVKTGQG